MQICLNIIAAYSGVDLVKLPTLVAVNFDGFSLEGCH